MIATTLKLGWRNIWRNRRRTLISMSAVGIGLVLVITYAGLMAGMMSEATEELDNTGMGHVELYATGFRPKRAAAAALPDAAALVGRLSLPEGAQASYRVVAKALASSARGSEGVELFGVDFAREREVSAALRDVRKGAVPAGDDGRGIVVGEGLAERLKLSVGSKLRVMVQRADGEMGAELYRVRGIFHSISPALSKRRVFVTAPSAQGLLGVGAGAHQVVVQLPQGAMADGLAATLRAALGPAVEVATWGELLPMLKTMEALIGTITTVAAIFVYLLVGLGILNTMLMSVLERTREFGVLMSVGTRPARLVALVLAESFWIGTMSAALGLGLGLFIMWYGSTHALMDMKAVGEGFDVYGTTISTSFRTKFVPGDALKAALYVYVMALFVGLYPALRVTKLRPAEAVRRA